MNSTQLAETTAFLKSVSFFSGVDKDALSSLCEDLAFKIFEKNEVVFQKGDPGDALYVIMEGAVKVHDEGHLFGELNTGHCFGEYALIDNKERSATVTSLQKSKLLKISRDHFMKLMLEDSGFAQGILNVMILRHRELDTIQERLAASKRELQIANSKMSGLINGAMDAIIMFDARFRIVLTNPSAEALLENTDVLQRNLLYFFDEESAGMIEKLVKDDDDRSLNKHLPSVVKVIGSNEKETINEGTLSKYGDSENSYYTLILRNLEERIQAEDTIDFLTTQTQYLNEEIRELTSSYGILAEDESMMKVLELINQVAPTTATVLITGETGTGKELVARGIHKAGDRVDKPLIRVNCGAIPANLIESELFGHEKGAFTGATQSRKGRFLLADKGTIFLDEIGELPLDLQPKLLRVIQEGEFDPLGSSETIKVDVRIIAATHKNLLEESKKGKFREDLYYRLNVFPIEVPALRDRGDDILLIAEEMIELFSAKLNKKGFKLTESDRAALKAYSWPGNVRELQNLVERAVIVSVNGKARLSDIIPGGEDSHTVDIQKSESKIYTSEEMVHLEKENILRALKKTRWKVSGPNGAAALLKIAPTTLSSRIKALGISRPL